uniref:Uncharacterized protein n=1 Tax=Arundo donax TaxID=35708 RepID=A0A0A8YYB3_ARUDO
MTTWAEEERRVARLQQDHFRRDNRYYAFYSLRSTSFTMAH